MTDKSCLATVNAVGGVPFLINELNTPVQFSLNVGAPRLDLAAPDTFEPQTVPEENPRMLCRECAPGTTLYVVSSTTMFLQMWIHGVLIVKIRLSPGKYYRARDCDWHTYLMRCRRKGLTPNPTPVPLTLPVRPSSRNMGFDPNCAGPQSAPINCATQ